MTWNVRSGRLVGGHQRLRILDTLNHGRAYKLTVAQVDMSDEEEKAANLLLNNYEASGEFDFEKLGEMLTDKSLDLEAAGFGAADIFKMVGEKASDAVLAEMAERIEKARGIHDATQTAAADEHSTDYYLVVVFRGPDERRAATDELGLDNNRYVSGDELMARLRPRLKTCP